MRRQPKLEDVVVVCCACVAVPAVLMIGALVMAIVKLFSGGLPTS